MATTDVFTLQFCLFQMVIAEIIQVFSDWLLLLNKMHLKVSSCIFVAWWLTYFYCWNGNPLQRSCLENPRDGGAWWAAIYGVAQSRTRLKRLSSSSSRIPLSGCTTTYLYVNLLKDILVVFKFWWLWIKLLQKSICEFLFRHKFLTDSGK